MFPIVPHSKPQGWTSAAMIITATTTSFRRRCLHEIRQFEPRKQYRGI